MQTLHQRKAATFLRTPPSQWQAIAGSLSTDDRYGIEREIASLCEAAARASAYLSRLQTAGSAGHPVPDNVHRAAVKHQNAIAAKVRRALGYTYPQAPIDF